MKPRQRGTALLLVLWATMLLAALLIGVAAASRSQSEAALYGSERARAELAAEAGLAHAIAGMRAPDVHDRWIPDGRPYTFVFDGAKVTVSVVDASGLMDLNAVSPDLLQGFFGAAGMSSTDAATLAATIVAWRGGDPTMAPAHGPLANRRPVNGPSAAARASQPRGPFRTIDQLLQLPGMNAARFGKIERSLTVFSGRNFPDASYAGALVLAALRGSGERRAKALVNERRQRPAQAAAGNGQALGAVANGPLVAGYGGMIARVFSAAEMRDGTRTGLDVTIRMALTTSSARPYKVLQWRTDMVGEP